MGRGFTYGIVVAVVALAAPLVAAAPAPAASPSPHAHIACEKAKFLCAELPNSDETFGRYVGHDEPALAFYSKQHGSGNRAQFTTTLPRDPSPKSPTTKSYTFQTSSVFWFSMALCDTQSNPRPLGPAAAPINPGLPCHPDSDTNIHENLNPKAHDALVTHPGGALLELQFYAPGWVPWPLNAGSCDSTRWCAALNIDSVSADDFHGTELNKPCQDLVGIEPVNFAFITKSGTPQPNSPPNPVQSTLDTFTPDQNADLFMQSGDKISVSLHDTPHGLATDVNDLTTGAQGSMTASAANGFGQVEYNPTGTTCKNLPYDFHPMYSTASEQTRVPWASHTVNIAFSDETGHFDNCSHVTEAGGCRGKEGPKTDQETADTDDGFCYPTHLTTLVKIPGCTDSNVGFDGSSYRPLWGDGNPLHPDPLVIGSPRTGTKYTTDYQRVAFENDLPSIEPACDISTTTGCTQQPVTDDGNPAEFYPFYTAATGYGDACNWTLGADIPGHTTNDFGKNAQQGSLTPSRYLLGGTGGQTAPFFTVFRQVLTNNPCTR